MKKDQTIIDLINKLNMLPNFNLVEVVDYWDGDLCAIGIKKGDRLVYISTFNSNGKYDYDLELLDEIVIDNINVIKEGRGVTEEMLFNEIKEHLVI
jgi:hypothetical protein